MSKAPRISGEKKTESIRLSFLHFAVFFGFLFLILGTGFVFQGFYITHWSGPVARGVSRMVPIPAASVNGELVYYTEVLELSALLNTVEMPEEMDAFEEGLEIAIRRKHVEQFGREFGLDGKQLLAETNASEIDMSFLDALGWSEAMYREYVLEPLVLAQELEERIYWAAEHQGPARDRMEHILENIEYGISFTDLAKQYSEGGAAPAGGDIGYVMEGDLDSGLSSLFDVEIGEVSDILEADRYFAVGYVYDALEPVEGEKQIGVQLITVNKLSLAEVLETYIPGQDVRVFVK